MIPIAFCTTDADCEDFDDCVTNECSIDPGETGGVCVDVVACVDEEHCVAGRCVECLDDADCDNANACDGLETCGDDGACADGEAPHCDDGDVCTLDTCDEAIGCANTIVACGVDEVCVEGICVTVCNGDFDCDDANACTAETCSEGVCSSTALDCDDGLFCTGVETCDSLTGACASSGNPCAVDECNEATDTCDHNDPCTGDADCPDDGLFCNGVESCEPDSGLCVSSGDPCANENLCNSLRCDEAWDLCLPGFICDPYFPLTLGKDDFFLSDYDDTISAPLAFNPPTGTNRPTLQTGDTIDGGEGDDQLYAQFNFTTPTTVAPTLVSLETIDTTDFGTAATTLDGAGITGTTQYNFISGTNTNAFVVSNLTALANLGVRNQGTGATLVFASAATNGSNDAVTLTLSGMSSGVVTFDTDPTNGIESLNVVSSPNANVLTAISMDEPPPNSLNISGDAPLTLIGAVAAKEIDATTFTAALTLTVVSTVATTVMGGSGNDTLYGTTGADSLSGGAGDDIFNGAAGADIITTGTGNDIVSMVVADAADTVTDFITDTDDFDWNTDLSSIDASVTTPGAATSFQSAVAGTPIAVTTTVFELTGITVASQTAANVVTALGATATNADIDANLLFVIYTTGGGGAIWNWVNLDADVETTELTLVATLSSVTADSLVGGNFR